MTDKLVVVINKAPKIKKMLPYEMKFLVPNYSCLQNPWLGGYRPPDPRSLCLLFSTEFVEPPLPNKIPGYATANNITDIHTPGEIRTCSCSKRAAADPHLRLRERCLYCNKMRHATRRTCCAETLRPYKGLLQEGYNSSLWFWRFLTLYTPRTMFHVTLY